MSIADIPFEQARQVADHLRARAEAHASRPVGLVLLALLTLLSRAFPQQTGPGWYTLCLALLAVGPFLLPRLLPRGNRFTYRLGLVGPGLNTALLALLVYLEWAKLPAPLLEDLGTLHWVLLAVAWMIPLFYLLGSLPNWLRRWRDHAFISLELARKDLPQTLPVLGPLVEGMLGREPGPEDAWATFRTVPPNPKDLNRFLRPDFTRHGAWRVLLHPAWALVVAMDGTRAEAVDRGSLRFVSDDLEGPEGAVLCLLRWNQHLHEGRILPGDARKLLDWIRGTPP